LKTTPTKVTVIAPARLHMGFIDLSGSLNRHFGSIGLALNDFETKLSLTASNCGYVDTQAPARTQQCVQQLCQKLGVSEQVHVNVHSAIPTHIGLGSGTQLALAVGMALNVFYQLNLSIRDIAHLTERGRRSGIGIGVFEKGGFVVDGGRGQNTITPPVLAQMPVPEEWRFILLLDQRGQGLHGDNEIQAFKALPPFSEEEAARLCYLLLMQGLPALAEQNINEFGSVITQLQQSVGDYFAPAQGGAFTSHEVGEVMAWCSGQGAVAIGQTSWGPTGFCAVSSNQQARELVAAAKQRFKNLVNLDYVITRVTNQGARIIVE